MKHIFFKAALAVLLIAAACLAARMLPGGCDINANGLCDEADIVIGARMDAIAHPEYDPSYFEQGYPPDDKGVCADVVWRAFRQAGYSLRRMLAADILARPDTYATIEEPDDTIDFRRVRNLKVFFDTYAECLTTDLSDAGAWQPGDIAIFRESKHIGIVSDRKNADGIPLLLHNGGQNEREQDYLSSHTPTAHYRFDAARLPKELIVRWDDAELAAETAQ